MKSFLSYLAALICILCITFVFVSAKGDKGRELLISFGWDVDQYPISKEKITIPTEFDKVYSEYNNIQHQAGLDLEQYKGQKGTRYTYKVHNHPTSREDVVANVIVINDKAVAGDICTYSLDGFMHSLRYSK